ncbi:hypothetical protein GCM10010412_022090 [Nonomuraea recticatena]|uniref:Uncharacterized protein n=1 Tax=Nonomuraea recticatena TaxID=46178 RepID=A0ABP6E0B5_9ACTN
MNENDTRMLAARLPGWTIWYGEQTGSFWALPKARGLPHIEAATAVELEQRARAVEQRLHILPVTVPRSATRPSATRPGRRSRRRRRTAGVLT